jgi:hypothetical protein
LRLRMANFFLRRRRRPISLWRSLIPPTITSPYALDFAVLRLALPLDLLGWYCPKLIGNRAL